MKFHSEDDEFRGLLKQFDLSDTSFSLPEQQWLRFRVFQASSEIRAAKDCEGFAAYIYSGSNFIDRTTRANMAPYSFPLKGGDLVAFSRAELVGSLVMTHWGISLGDDLVLSKYGQGDVRVSTIEELMEDYRSELVLSSS